MIQSTRGGTVKNIITETIKTGGPSCRIHFRLVSKVADYVNTSDRCGPVSTGRNIKFETKIGIAGNPVTSGKRDCIAPNEE